MTLQALRAPKQSRRAPSNPLPPIGRCRNPDGVEFHTWLPHNSGMAKKPARERVWEISRIKRTPAAILGRNKAPNAETAVKEWIEKFNITDPEQQSRLVARPVNDG